MEKSFQSSCMPSLVSSVYNFIFDCKGGEIELLDLIQNKTPIKGFTEAKALEVLNTSVQDDPEGKSTKTIFAIGVNSNGRKTIRVLCKARLCSSYDRNRECLRGENCLNLHVCKGFLEENCHDANVCLKSHNLLDKQNKKILQRYDLEIARRPNSTIRNMITKNLPFVCKQYIDNECKNLLCQNLHLCPRFVRDVCCSADQDCPTKLSHDLSSSHNKKIFKKYQLPEQYLKCHILLPRGIKLGKLKAEEMKPSVKVVLNNLDAYDEKTKSCSSKLTGLKQNIFLGREECKSCLASSEDRQMKRGQKSGSIKEEEENLDLNVRSQSLQKWSSTDCFQTTLLLPDMRSMDGQMGTFRPSCSVPHSLNGRKDVKSVDIARGLSNANQEKPSNWTGRGRGRPLKNCEPIAEPNTGTQERKKKKKRSKNAVFNCIFTKFNGAAKFSDISSLKDLFDSSASVEEKEKYFRENKSRFLIIENAQGKIKEVKTISFRAKMCPNYLGKSAHCGSKRCPYFHICEDYIANGRCLQPGICKRNHGFCNRQNEKLASELFPNVEFTEEHLRQLIKSSTPQVCLDYNDRNCRSCLQCKKIHVCKLFVSGKCNGKCNLLHGSSFRSPETKMILKLLNVSESVIVNDKELVRTLLVCSDLSNDNDAWKEVEKDNEGREISRDGDKSEDRAVLIENDDDDDDDDDDNNNNALIMTVDGDGNKKNDNEEYSIDVPVIIGGGKTSGLYTLGNNICMEFLQGKCKHELCVHSDHHYFTPYQWVYIVADNDEWRTVDDDNENTNLERLFCQENVAEGTVPLKVGQIEQPSVIPKMFSVDFTKMEIIRNEDGKTFPVIRLTTASQVHFPSCPLATKWRWFCREPDGKFIECQRSNQMDSSVATPFSQQKSKGPKSDDIEKHYLEGHSTYDYEMAGKKYRIYFRETPMYQRALDPLSSTIQEVCRRPNFISSEEFKHLKSVMKDWVFPLNDARQLPSTWSKMAECQDHLLVKLHGDSKEYQEIESLFFSHMRDKHVTICSIDRVQNPFLWEKYVRKKKHMQKMAAATEYSQHDIEERLLFHGTSRRNLRRTCKQNFDWRSYGDGASNIYGEGVYFLKDPSLSHLFCQIDEVGSRHTFIFNVLVGSFTEGKRNYRRPPPKDPSDYKSDPFDSCVDRVGDPQVFVIFDVDQYYPGYLLEYRTKDSCTAELETCSLQ